MWYKAHNKLRNALYCLVVTAQDMYRLELMIAFLFYRLNRTAVYRGVRELS